DGLGVDVAQVVGLSLKVAFWSVAVSLPPAMAVAWLLARREFPGKVLVDAVVHLPLVLPPVVVGFALLFLLGRQGPLGALLAPLGISFAFKWTGAALAAAVMGFPLLVRALRLSLESMDVRLESAARTLGAGPWPARARRPSAARSSPCAATRWCCSTSRAP
ncbi:MAG TPA: ABC transporter permease subunit, partial [Phenylobacterium sp.]|nr:ABC transporter permease subunit [Phenylobacterium sp.]